MVDTLNDIEPPYREGDSDKVNRTLIKFVLHQKVQKCHGYYRYPGIIVSIFETLSGRVRYVVEADHRDFIGMLHIFSENDLEPRE